MVACATAALIFSFAGPSLAQDAGGQGKDNGVGQGIIPPPPGQNPGQQGQFGKGKGKGKQRPPSRPTPHGPDGHVLLGPLPGEKGVWNGSVSAVFSNGPARGGNAAGFSPTNPNVADVPFQDWARALYESRRVNNTADDPHVRCKSSGGLRLYHTPYGFEIVDVPELERIYMMGVG